MDKWDYFWENTDEPLLSVSTKNFEYFLMEDQTSNLRFELRVGKIGAMSLKVVTRSDFRKYNGLKSDIKNPWD